MVQFLLLQTIDEAPIQWNKQLGPVGVVASGGGLEREKGPTFVLHGQRRPMYSESSGIREPLDKSVFFFFFDRTARQEFFFL